MRKGLSVAILALLMVSLLAGGCPPLRQPAPPGPFPAPDIEWSRTFGGAYWERAYSVQQTACGGFIVAGATTSFGAGHADSWLVKTDPQGNKEWSRTFGGTGSEGATSVQQTADGGFIIVGSTMSLGAGTSYYHADIWLAKTDPQGNKEWSRTFGGDFWDDAHSVQQTACGGFIIAGWTKSFGAGVADIWLIKTDSKENKEWSRTFGGRYDWEWAFSVQQTADGGFIIAGEGEPRVGANDDFWLIKTDKQGNKEWSRFFGGCRAEGAHSLQQTACGGFIIAGWTRSFSAGSADFWLVKTDSEGNREWHRAFGGRRCDYAYSVKQTACGGFIIAGWTESFGAGDHDVWVVKTDSQGNKKWSRTFGGGGDDAAYSVQQTACDGFIIVGETESFGAGGGDVWLIKLAPETGQ